MGRLTFDIEENIRSSESAISKRELPELLTVTNFPYHRRHYGSARNAIVVGRAAAVRRMLPGSKRRSHGGECAEREAVGLSRPPGADGARGDDEIRCRKWELGVRRSPREFSRQQAATQPDHRKNGVQRHVDPRDFGPCEAAPCLAHSERFQSKLARGVRCLRLQVRLFRPRLFDPELGSTDSG